MRFSMVIPTFNAADDADSLLTFKVMEAPICSRDCARDISKLSFQ